MADGGPPAPPAPQPPPGVPPVPPVQMPVPPVQLILLPAQPIVPPTQPIQPAPMPQLNLSHLKTKFAGKSDEDLEAHLLKTNDWMDTYAFLEGVKVQYFCLTLVGEARLWCESLRPINVNWNR